jgi:hypothetical protein
MLVVAHVQLRLSGSRAFKFNTIELVGILHHAPHVSFESSFIRPNTACLHLSGMQTAIVFDISL